MQKDNKKDQNTTQVNDQSKKVLGGILQNAEMAKHSTSVVVKYVKDQSFLDKLNCQIDKYDEYINKTKELARVEVLEFTREDEYGI